MEHTRRPHLIAVFSIPLYHIIQNNFSKLADAIWKKLSFGLLTCTFGGARSTVANFDIKYKNMLNLKKHGICKCKHFHTVLCEWHKA